MEKGKVLRNLNVKDFLYIDAEADSTIYTGWIMGSDAGKS